MPARITLSVPNLSGKELEYISAAVNDNWVSYAGPQTRTFEERLAAATGAGDAAVMASGTAALHIALLLAGVQPGDEVLLPALTFVAPANAVRYCGAWPTFVDVSASDWQVDPAQLRNYLETECRRDACGTESRPRCPGLHLLLQHTWPALQ